MLLFIHLLIWGCAGSSFLCRLFSSRSERGYFLALEGELLTVAASLVAEHSLSGPRASAVAVCGLSIFGSQALEHRLSRCG